jgi:threonine/homoserine/homoserine lactone efflux protein
MPFLVGLVIGFLMCVPVGPINIWVVNTQLKRGFREAFAIALGGSFMDFLYFVALSSGVSLLPIDERAALWLKAGGVLLLLGMGIKELFWAQGAIIQGQDAPGRNAPKTHDPWRFFAFGVVIYASNPTLVATLTGLTAMIRSWDMFAPDLVNHAFLGLGAAAGSALWFLFLLWLVRRYQHLIQGKAMLWASRACGALVVGLALWMGYKLAAEF